MCLSGCYALVIYRKQIKKQTNKTLASPYRLLQFQGLNLFQKACFSLEFLTYASTVQHSNALTLHALITLSFFHSLSPIPSTGQNTGRQSDIKAQS